MISKAKQSFTSKQGKKESLSLPERTEGALRSFLAGENGSVPSLTKKLHSRLAELNTALGVLSLSRIVGVADGVAAVAAEVARLIRAVQGDRPKLRPETLATTLKEKHTSRDFALLTSPLDDNPTFSASEVPPVPLQLRLWQRKAPTGASDFFPCADEPPKVSSLVAEDHPHIVCGVAGSGKTWLTRRIAHCHATGARYDSANQRSASFDQHGISRIIVLRLQQLRVPRDGETAWDTVAEIIARAVAQQYNIDQTYDSKDFVCVVMPHIITLHHSHLHPAPSQCTPLQRSS